MKKIEAHIRPEKVQAVMAALDDAGIHGMSFMHITGRGAQRGVIHQGRGGETITVDTLPKVKIEAVVPDDKVENGIAAIMKSAATGNIGDGKIFVTAVEEAIRVRTGERGASVL